VGGLLAPRARDRDNPTRPSVRVAEPAAQIVPEGGVKHHSLGRRRARLALSLLAPLAVAVALSGCGTAGKIAAGVVIGLDAPDGQVMSFTLRTTDGQVMRFSIGTLETDGAAFPASHLAVHAATLAPIAVAYREDGGRNVVYRMADAPWARQT